MSHEENPFSDPPRLPPKAVRSTSATHDGSKQTVSSSQYKRGQNQDSAGEQKPRGSKGRKKGSQHADVIDRLDFTGVGPMFHHDGPFDACAPSRNRHRNQAPMLAWSPTPQQQQFSDPSPYPSPNAYSSYPTPPPPRKKVDAIAEAWGTHEPEPYEEFFAGGGTMQDGSTPTSSIYNGKEKDRESRSRPRHAARKSALPPPQPIFTSDSLNVSDPNLANDMSGGGPKRSKSLMQRIRKMRDSPNVPVDEAPPGHDDQMGTSRPTHTHRSQNSFLGKFTKEVRGKDSSMSPTEEKPEPYVYIEPHSPGRRDHSSAPGADSSNEAYFEHGGMGRKTSIMKKMGRVVRGPK